MMRLSRRSLIKSLAAAPVLAQLSPAELPGREEQPSVRRITHAPGHHWFGYYDKLQFDPTVRFVLGMQVGFEHRSPTRNDVIRIGMVDLQQNDRWIELGTSSAWCWQQGCMLQWLPGSSSKVIWNDRQEGSLVSHILDVKSRKRRTIPRAIYSVSPDGKSAVAPDFRRIQDLRPGYGYAGEPDPLADDLAPRDSGIFHVDLESGESRLILSLADIARYGPIPDAQPGIKHYFNHLLFSPDGSRFIALHRWRYPNGSRLTRLITARPDGRDVRVVIPNGYASHFIWKDSTSILSQSRKYLGHDGWGNFLFEDKDGGGQVKHIGQDGLDPFGHLSYLPGNDWILNDTYPQGSARMQTPHLFHVESGRRIDLGHFHLPPLYTGEWRVDTHPRYSPDGRFVCIDAPHREQGRQLHLIDIHDILSS